MHKDNILHFFSPLIFHICNFGPKILHNCNLVSEFLHNCNLAPKLLHNCKFDPLILGKLYFWPLNFSEIPIKSFFIRTVGFCRNSLLLATFQAKLAVGLCRPEGGESRGGGGFHRWWPNRRRSDVKIYAATAF